MAKLLVRFKGDGDEPLNSDALHLDHPMIDATLCGLTMDGDSKTAGNFECIVAKRVTCQQCVSIIIHCRSVDI